MNRCVTFLIGLLYCLSVYAADGELVWDLPDICQEDEYKNECFCTYSAPIKRSGAYTIDLRKYVSDAEWAGGLPYKYLLRMMIPNEDTEKLETQCTGNMINGKIITARHCLADEMKCEQDRKNYYFRMYDGTEIRAKVADCGAQNEQGTGDWVIMDVVDTANQKIVREHSLASVEDIKGAYQIKKFANENGNKKLVSSGFDSLKVMNDAEIEIFQKAFRAHLESYMPRKSREVRVFNEGTMPGMAFVHDLEMSSKCLVWAQEYNQTKDSKIKKRFDKECMVTDDVSFSGYGGRQYSGLNYAACGLYYDEIFNDNEKMKTSTCLVAGIKPMKSDGNAILDGDYDSMSDGEMILTECQSWGGRSGGGLYFERGVDDFSLVGTVSMGMAIIGGEHHASKTADSYVPAGNFIDKLSQQ